MILIRPAGPCSLLQPFSQRFGIGLIFSASGYVLGAGDVRNGSDIMTCTSCQSSSMYRAVVAHNPHFERPTSPGPFSSLSLYPMLSFGPCSRTLWHRHQLYLAWFLTCLRGSLSPPHSALSLFMTASTVASAALYGIEYFAVDLRYRYQ